jgi:hemerythrin-like domain-containing protein
MEKATDILKHEHQIILMVLDAAQQEAKRIQQNKQVEEKTIQDFLDFLRNFADRCHHAKEEDLLFVRMEQHGIPGQGGPIAVMLAEHDQGRKHIEAISRALPEAIEGNIQAVDAITDHLLDYVDLLRSHIYKEDHILYPMADRLFNTEDQVQLIRDFDRVEAEEIGTGVHEKYHQLAHELAGQSMDS